MKYYYLVLLDSDIILERGITEDSLRLVLERWTENSEIIGLLDNADDLISRHYQRLDTVVGVAHFIDESLGPLEFERDESV